MERLLGAIVISLFLSAAASAAGPKDYQVTGPVLDVKDDVIVVQKGTEKWEIGRDKDTKVDGDLKKGARVTVKYKMTASGIEVKDAAKAATKSKTDGKAKVDEKKTESKTK
jgi:hypothetical protein